jgi:hypothetical protein
MLPEWKKNVYDFGEPLGSRLHPVRVERNCWYRVFVYLVLVGFFIFGLLEASVIQAKTTTHLLRE